MSEWRRALMTEQFYDFLCQPEIWAEVFEPGTMRERLAELVLNHVMVGDLYDGIRIPNTHLETTLAKVKNEDPEPDFFITPIVTAEVEWLIETKEVDYEQAAVHIANVSSETARQHVGYLIASGLER